MSDIDIVRGKLGNLLLEAKLITKEQLDEGLMLQKRTEDNDPIGEILVDLGYLSEDGLARMLSKQLKIKYVSFGAGTLVIRFDQNLNKLVSEEFARNNKVLPLSQTPETVFVTMWNPLDFTIIDNLKRMLGKDIVVYCSTRKDILEGINRLYVIKGPPTDESSYATAPLQPDRRGRDETEQLKLRASEPPVIKLVNSIVHGAIEELASDIHIEPHEEGFDIRYRVDGLLYKIDGPSKDMYAPVVSRIKIMSRLDIAEKRLPQDGGFMVKIDNRSVDFRVSSIPTIYGEKIVIRVLDKESMNFSLSSIGMSKENYLKVSDAIKKPYGLIFLTGPTGSGKTTTLYCILNEIKSPQKNVITIEDPVEYRIVGANQVQELPNIGLTFARGLRAFLRQDPDIIMVGEVRDFETAEMCVRSALIGRLVLSTLHTNDSLGAITRLIDFGIEPFLVSSSLSMVIAQRLVRKLCPICKELITVDKSIIEKHSLGDAKLYGPKGCKQCHNRGFVGRLAIFEILIADKEIRNLIESKRDMAVIREALDKKGMKSLRYDAMDKVRQGLTSLDEAIIATMENF